MKGLEEETVSLMVTSPPYNVGKTYDDNLTVKDYFDLLYSVLSRVIEKLVYGGIAAVNIANVGRKPYIPFDSLLMDCMENIGYKIVREIIWNKSASAGGSCAWGSWKSASNPSLRDVHEYIVIGSKGKPITRDLPDQFTISIEGNDLKISPKKFLESNIWNFKTESAKKVGHPAPFPVDLPSRLIAIYTNKNDLVLDPFCGSGTTAIASISLGRRFVGYDTDAGYCESSKSRVVKCLRGSV
jgi:site-specific DNA-methyltransferase (adenine-specific)